MRELPEPWLVPCRAGPAAQREEGREDCPGGVHHDVYEGVVLALDDVARRELVEGPLRHLPKGADGDPDAGEEDDEADGRPSRIASSNTNTASQKVIAKRVAACRTRSNHQYAA